MRVEKRTAIRVQGKHQFGNERLVSRGHLRGIENFGHRAEDNHDPAAEEREGRDHNHGQDRDDQGVFNQRLPLSALPSAPDQVLKDLDYMYHGNSQWRSLPSFPVASALC
jgi:hypothetical protein